MTHIDKHLFSHYFASWSAHITIVCLHFSIYVFYHHVIDWEKCTMSNTQRKRKTNCVKNLQGKNEMNAKIQKQKSTHKSKTTAESSEEDVTWWWQLFLPLNFFFVSRIRIGSFCSFCSVGKQQTMLWAAQQLAFLNRDIFEMCVLAVKRSNFCECQQKWTNVHLIEIWNQMTCKNDLFFFFWSKSLFLVQIEMIFNAF